jgi:chemotaxis signal transduction protein
MSISNILTPSIALSRPFVLAEIQKIEEVEQTVDRGFKVAGLGLLVKTVESMELLDKPKIFPLPKVHRYCLGLISLRGIIFPLFDFRKEIMETKAFFRWVLVFNNGLKTAAFVIDELPIQLLPEEIEPLDSIPDMPAFLAPFILSGLSVNKKDFYFELDAYSLLNSIKNH